MALLLERGAARTVALHRPGVDANAPLWQWPFLLTHMEIQSTQENMNQGWDYSAQFTFLTRRYQFYQGLNLSSETEALVSVFWLETRLNQCQVMPK